MSSSKIFSGDLPELIYEIIEYFQNDYSTLHSCILVNKLWCRLAIPLLWENPFSITTGNYNFIKVYLYNLNKYLKATLSKYQIIDSLLTSNTLFNYPSFIRYLNIDNINTSINMWLRANDITLNMDLVFEFKNFINMSLIKLFIENEVNLHTLDLEASNTNYDTYIENILEIILQNPNFISNNIRNLKFSISSSGSKIVNRVTQIINSNQNLKKISLISNTNTFLLYQSLLLSKESNCSNTLNTIIFYYINFNGINNLDKIFEQLNVLESVHIIFCYSLDSFIQQIIKLTKPFKLKSLFLLMRLQIESLQLLLQKSGNYLENLGDCLNYNNLSSDQQLLQLIINYCKNIRFLDLHSRINDITSSIFSLIENIKQNLNYLSINLSNYEDNEYSNIKSILQNLGQTLPSKLEYLSLVLRIKENDIEIFLKNSQDNFFNKLVIKNKKQEDDNYIDILPYIKEYVMRKKRVKYLAIENTLIRGCVRRKVDLFDLKDEVKEFKLHNIKVLSYNELSIGVYRFLNEID
ncbi:hypothetical protein GLOIN_2v1871144 [Rhizophagus irregularis DAOM 181602=DAOM 197198]|uniref:F-box domain-containing protein n=1 Tax=Rhizophagus irregularis (strain DAOM 181602 / DAOM 197198 / MUCL 43194) TaxID=747089 RepID=A0A2P4QJ64_RHIID|nr:hypothetical protein GLOIN_2v1871144 [Rhizophagus irregularis DAOM 181602=DAOM 197198]POG77692.1 hypothetical protein GLOIN_2v1871144 [Rhizophagus irregularis DAOM 181602=DAOM 197198]|eukprot:XP_025184558.1 hypothetical protein GLOIN_2v1871144 [Rhizophagus irregularis DAOM 181602=DAOM 197198]